MANQYQRPLSASANAKNNTKRMKTRSGMTSIDSWLWKRPRLSLRSCLSWNACWGVRAKVQWVLIPRSTMGVKVEMRRGVVVVV